mmetsp:Transcript_25593/g.35885  ORF Transcript_25593/g.35885 Transcript_25593/m.35885 type:complete len:90 (-) Transcript_25593:399-668(-)
MLFYFLLWMHYFEIRTHSSEIYFSDKGGCFDSTVTSRSSVMVTTVVSNVSEIVATKWLSSSSSFDRILISKGVTMDFSRNGINCSTLEA